MTAPIQIPRLESLGEYFPTLAKMVSNTSRLPHPDTVKALGRPAFPTSRAKSEHSRYTNIVENNEPIGMYDDNTTPTWAMLWAHGIVGGSRKGWAFAHVWPASDDINSYTHLANLAMVPEPFASLTDKTGPLTGFLRWHAWHVYAWKPEREAEPSKPVGYGAIEWRYLESVDSPRALIRQRMESADNQRTRILRPIMERRGWL